MMDHLDTVISSSDKTNIFLFIKVIHEWLRYDNGLRKIRNLCLFGRSSRD